MQRFRGEFGRRARQLLSTLRLMTVTMPILFVVAIALPTHAQEHTQKTSATSLKFEYEVASIKPTGPESSNGVMSGMTYPADGFTVRGYTLRSLIQSALGVQNYQLSGAPAWLISEKYDIDAKMDSSVVDALQKLTPKDQFSARQQMLLALFADRLKLTFHRETKELPIYSLVIAKSGAKLQEAKPGDTLTDGSRGRAGRGRADGLGTTIKVGSETLRAQSVPLTELVQALASYLGRAVVDNTGLTGNYNFTLQWTTDDAQMQAPSGAAASGTPTTSSADPTAAFLFTAIQQQLGLKLESGKGPVEVFVIDHVERPSGN